LQFAGDGQEHHISEAVEVLAGYLQLSEDQVSELLASGKRRKFDDRVRWAKTYLQKANLLESTGRGTFRITRRGLEVLKDDPTFINRAFLKQYPEFQEFITPAQIDKGDQPFMEMVETPRALMHTMYENLRIDLAEELLDYILSASPAFFERLVIDLLVAMGYGGTLTGAGKVTKRSGDSGIDGIIQQDKLGLETIYVQAKRYARDNVVGRPAVQAFVGSLTGVGAKKGVFITTSRFSREAVEYAQNVQHQKVILIDGQQLTQLMIDHDVGVSVEQVYVIKHVDSDYFDVE
jgi:restriction system protein